MSLTKLERDKQKLIQDKCQQILTELLRDEDNKYCVDCDSKGPRWASWNLGIFLCIRCAGIHRNLGVHISRVKSVNLDSWTPEQVGSIQNMGNSKARAVYEANLPDNFSRPQTDSALESFIRSKYEHKKYIAKEWVETSPKPAFDVEMELKKEKDKKKSKVQVKSISPIGAQADIQSNPIPRPNASVNGKTEKVPSQAATQAAPKVEPSSSGTTDLLGLDLISSANDEPFGFFTSADTAVASNKEEAIASVSQPKESKSLEDEEKDFFSQKAPEKSQEKKLTKESILSLYSQTPATNPLNGFMGQPVNPINQFPAGNSAFGQMNPAKSANLMASTNPFLANSNSAFMPSDLSQPQLVQGFSSLQLNPTPISQIPMGGAPAANTQSNLNWFSGPTGPNSMPLGQQSSLANPFVDSNSSTFGALSSGNILNFDLKPNGSNSGFNLTNPTASASPNPLLSNTNQKSDPASQLTNFW